MTITNKLLAIGSALIVCLRVADASEVRVVVSTRDDRGALLPGIEVIATTFSHWEPGEAFGRDVVNQQRGISDARGRVVFRIPLVRGEVSLSASGKNVYRTGSISRQFARSTEGYWVPAEMNVDLELKPIEEPVPFYGRRVRGIEIPDIERPMGFDLIVGDWVAPYGRGERVDFVFTVSRAEHDSGREISARMTLSFPNPEDGVLRVAVPVSERGELRLPRYAPETGYAPMFSKRYERSSREQTAAYEYDEEANYIFRVRTEKVDGRIVSAMYGKIYGDIRFDVVNSKSRALIIFTYYVNPLPNSRNLEFDPKQNLFKNLGPLERVREP